MPTTVQLKVIVGARGAEGLRTGDTVTIKGRAGVVQSMRELTTNMEVTLVDHSLQSSDQETTWTRRVPLDSEINVLRTQPTEEEQLQADLEKFAEMCSTKWEQLNRAMYARLSSIQTALHDGMAKGYAKPFDFDRAASLAALQEEYALWSSVKADIDEDGNLPSVVKAVMRVRMTCERRLTARYGNALSRSSSVTHNLQEDMMLDAMAKFLEDTSWEAPGLWERVGAGQSL